MATKQKIAELESPTNFKRLPNGMLENVTYIYKENGLVDWAKMIPNEFIVPNADRFPKDTNLKELRVEDLKDEEKLVLLGGWEYLSLLRGYNSLTYKPLAAFRDFVSVECTIVWDANYETNFKERTVSSTADAHPDNLKSFAQLFPTTIAENRAFGRCLRRSLNIPILSKDELGQDSRNVSQDDNSFTGHEPINRLKEVMQKANITFEAIKNAYVKEGTIENATDNQKQLAARASAWTSEKDIQPVDMFTIITRINEKKKK